MKILPNFQLRSFVFLSDTMSKEYAKRLKEFSESNDNTYQKVLDDYQNDIIDRFGGLNTMIQLCLTNDQFSTDTYKPQFESFKTFMKSQNINIGNEYLNALSGIDPEETTVGDKKHNGAILPNLEEFYRYSLGLVVYYSDNLYFTWLSPEKAKYICDDVLATKMYPICVTGTAITLLLTSSIYAHFIDYDNIFYSLMTTCFSMGTFLSLSYIFSANISVIKFIIQTFEFWYKMFNLIFWIISGYFINASSLSSWWYHVVASVTIICVYSTLFVLDATCILNKYKNMFIIAVVSFGMYIGLDVYFFTDPDDRNLNWNPFEQYNFKYSKIDFKSVFISSQLNLCLFISKPIFTQMSRKIRRYIQNKKNGGTSTSARKSTKDDGIFVQRSYILYKRPYIHWVVDCNSDLIGIGAPETRVISVNNTASRQVSFVAVHSRSPSTNFVA